MLSNSPKKYASESPPKSCCEIPLKIMPQILPQNHAVKFTQKLSLHSLPKNIFRESYPKYPPKKLGNSLPPKISSVVRSEKIQKIGCPSKKLKSHFFAKNVRKIGFSTNQYYCYNHTHEHFTTQFQRVLCHKKLVMR